MNFRKTRRSIDALELTPLIDVIFQLLIFFLLTTTFVTTPGMAIDRPQARHSAPLDKEKLVILIPKEAEGSVFFQGERLSYPQLRQKLLEIHKQSPHAQIAIDADQEVPHRLVVKVMDLITGVGLRRIGIVTSPESSSP